MSIPKISHFAQKKTRNVGRMSLNYKYPLARNLAITKYIYMSVCVCVSICECVNELVYV